MNESRWGYIYQGRKRHLFVDSRIVKYGLVQHKTACGKWHFEGWRPASSGLPNCPKCEATLLKEIEHARKTPKP